MEMMTSLSFSWEGKNSHIDDFIQLEDEINPLSTNKYNDHSTVTSFESFAPNELEMDESFLNQMQYQFSVEFDNFAISPPEKEFTIKKRASRSKNIQIKRKKYYSPISSWQSRHEIPDFTGTPNSLSHLYPSPSSPLCITNPVLCPEYMNSPSQNDKFMKKPFNIRNNDNYKNRLSRKDDKEIVITLNKTENDDPMTNLDIYDEFTINKDVDQKKNESNDKNYSDYDFPSFLKLIGFVNIDWINKVEIPPTKEYKLNENELLDFEKEANRYLLLNLDTLIRRINTLFSEFFEGNNVKTPERYMKIRNYIIRQWNYNKTKYITKTSVRKGLKDCGDVNAIGRVHQFLELIGAINFGLEAPASCRKQGQPEPISVYLNKKFKCQT